MNVRMARNNASHYLGYLDEFSTHRFSLVALIFLAIMWKVSNLGLKFYQITMIHRLLDFFSTHAPHPQISSSTRTFTSCIHHNIPFMSIQPKRFFEGIPISIVFMSLGTIFHDGDQNDGETK